MSGVSPNSLRGGSLAFLSAIILSTTGLFIRHLTRDFHLDPLALAVWRAGFAAATLFLVLGVARPSLLRVGRGDLWFLALHGLVLAGFNATWTVAVALTGASLATVLVNGSAAFTAVLGWWLLQEHLDWIKGLAVAASLAGCAVVSGATDRAAWSVNALGILTGVAAAVFYAAYSLLGRTASRRGLSPWTTVAYTFAFACSYLFILSRFSGRSLLSLGTSFSGWAWLFLLAAGPTVVGFGLYNASMKHLPSSVANLIVTSEPVFTTLLAYRLLGEWLDGRQAVGSVLILGGVALLQISERWRLEPATRPASAMD